MLLSQAINLNLMNLTLGVTLLFRCITFLQFSFQFVHFLELLFQFVNFCLLISYHLLVGHLVILLLHARRSNHSICYHVGAPANNNDRERVGVAFRVTQQNEQNRNEQAP